MVSKMVDLSPLKNGEHLEILLRQLQEGSRSSAFLLLREISNRLRSDPSSIPQSVREWLADSLNDIAYERVPGAKALGVKGKAKILDPEDTIHFTVKAVFEHIQASGLPLHLSETSPSAFKDAAIKFNISASTAAKYFYFAQQNYPNLTELEYLKEVIGLSDEDIAEHFKNEYL